MGERQILCPDPCGSSLFFRFGTAFHILIEIKLLFVLYVKQARNLFTTFQSDLLRFQSFSHSITGRKKRRLYG